MGRASAVLIVSTALVAWYETAPHVGTVSEWQSVAVIALGVMPGLFALDYLLLPFSGGRWVPLAIALGIATIFAIALSAAQQPVLSNLAKFVAVTIAGWLFMRLIEELSWSVLIAVVIPFIDAYSVWKGPTHTITAHHAGVFTSFSIAFVVPGGSAARLGFPDVFFFAVFLSCALRFGLRPFASWLVMVASLGVTVVATTYWATNGLPALPAISFGFLVPNTDLLWRRLRARPVLWPER